MDTIHVDDRFCARRRDPRHRNKPAQNKGRRLFADL